MKISMIDAPYLVAGSVPFGVDDIHSLHQQGVRAILSLTVRPLIGSSGITRTLLEELDILSLHTPVPDHFPPSAEQVTAALDFIEQMKMQKRMTFVHCSAGVGRTGTLLHAYFIARGCSLDEAAVRVKERRIECILLSEKQKTFLRLFSDGMGKFRDQKSPGYGKSLKQE